MRQMGARIRAPAKVNLWLDVRPRDASGFHAVDTLFCALDLSDVVAVAPFERGLELSVSGADLGPPESNLAWRAAREFMRAAHLDTGARLTLVKNIPSGAGLGGGSSDAAAALRSLAALHGALLSPADLRRIGASLGRDVPFFLAGSTLARGLGYGEALEPLQPLPSKPVLIALPPTAMPTAEAYRLLDEARATRTLATPPGPRYHDAGSWEDVARTSENDFEPVLLRRIPELEQGLTLLRRNGAFLARLAGSGSAVFGVFNDEGSRDQAARQIDLELPSFRCWSARTLTQLPYVEAMPVPA